MFVTHLLLLFLGLCYNPTAATNTNFAIKRFELCNITQGVIKFNGNITKEGGNQYLSFDLSTPVPIDEKLGGSGMIETKVGNVYVELFTVRDNYFCKAFNTYLGEFWYDIQRAAQVPPGVCPIREGRYHVHHMQLDFQKISLQTFPFGTLRFTLRAINNKHREIYMGCLLIEVENIPN